MATVHTLVPVVSLENFLIFPFVTRVIYGHIYDRYVYIFQGSRLARFWGRNLLMSADAQCCVISLLLFYCCFTSTVNI